jgi:AAA+ ATPase superfamily predicted ATPase
MLLAGSGTTRQSEFATRLEKSATSLARPLAALIEMGYLRRELPFGENEKNSKRGLYKINDPFMRFHYRFVIANKSRIEGGMNDRVIEEWKKNFTQFIGETWEQLCREALPFLKINNQDWDIARRWWGNNTSKIEFEFDAVSESMDKKTLLIGECKWSDNPNIKSICKGMDDKIKSLPLANKLKIQKVLFLKQEPNENVPKDYLVITPQTVLNALR